MESLILVLVGILVAVATYLILSKQLLRVILGTAVLSHAAHLLILTMGGLKRGCTVIRRIRGTIYRCITSSININSDCD